MSAQFTYRNDVQYPDAFNPMWRMNAAASWNIPMTQAGFFVRAETAHEAEAIAARHLVNALNDHSEKLLAAAKLARDFIQSLPYEPSNAASTKAQDALNDAIAEAEGAGPSPLIVGSSAKAAFTVRGKQ